MTVSTIGTIAEHTGEACHAAGSACTLSAGGAYAARLVRSAACGTGPGGAEQPVWHTERWTLGGPEPYRVSLAGRPEGPGTEVLPWDDGRVLVHRREGHRHVFALLYPTGPGTREIPLGALDCPAHPGQARPRTLRTAPPPRPAGLDRTQRPGAPAPRERPGGTERAAGTAQADRTDRHDRAEREVAGDPVRAPGARQQGRWVRQAETRLLTPAPAPVGTQDAAAHRCAPGGTVCRAVRLLPPPPSGTQAYALAVGPRSTTLWQVADVPSGPQRVAEIPGRCSGGAWLERTGRLLAVDQEVRGRTKTVTVDLGRGGAVTPLLEISAESTDRLLLADPDSGLLLIRSDAPSPGHERLAWGVLGSTMPARFPECLRLPDAAVTPFAIQPGQALTPERCAVALRVDGATGSRLAVWRPAEHTLHYVPAPEGWLTGCGAWTPEGVLHLPYATRAVPCGLARLPVPEPRTALAGHAPRTPRPVPLRHAPLVDRATPPGVPAGARAGVPAGAGAGPRAGAGPA